MVIDFYTFDAKRVIPFESFDSALKAAILKHSKIIEWIVNICLNGFQLQRTWSRLTVWYFITKHR